MKIYQNTSTSQFRETCLKRLYALVIVDSTTPREQIYSPLTEILPWLQISWQYLPFIIITEFRQESLLRREADEQREEDSGSMGQI